MVLKRCLARTLAPCLKPQSRTKHDDMSGSDVDERVGVERKARSEDTVERVEMIFG